MAFELAALDPTSVPINLLNPRPGTKFGDRDLIDPWEAVKFIAIFRLILPEALFRLCGGRVENLGELQPLAVKAGLNGVMMGNFLTTLGAEPEEDRAMFEELGLNVARQPDNGSNPRPDNRSRLARRRGAETPIDDYVDSRSEANFWDPSTQLRLHRKKQASALSGGGRGPSSAEPPAGATEPARANRERDPAAPRGAQRAGASTGACDWCPDRRARACCSTASACCCCARTTTSAWRTTRACARRRRGPRCATASAPARRA